MKSHNREGFFDFLRRGNARKPEPDHLGSERMS
jgi:hypothetical protein